MWAKDGLVLCFVDRSRVVDGQKTGVELKSALLGFTDSSLAEKVKQCEKRGRRNE